MNDDSPGDNDEKRKKQKLKFFDLGEAFEEVKFNFNYGTGGDKAKSSAKMVGKTVLNVGILAAKIGAAAIERAPGELAKQAGQKLKENPGMTHEEREKYERIIEMNNKLKSKKRT